MATTSVWGLNEKGELVAVAGTGSSNIVGFLNEDFLPTDAQGRLIIAGIGSGGGGGGGGANGKTILSGTVAPTGVVGTDGDFYINTATSTLYGPKSGGVWPAGVGLVGPSGNTVLNGSGAPSSGIGSNGDFYINTATTTIYGPKAAGNWPAGVNLVGTSSGGGGGGSSAYDVAPSGDTTGAPDLAAINAALAATGRVVLQAGGQYYVNGPIVLGSNNTLSAYGAKISLVAGKVGNIIRNAAVVADKTVTDANVINPGMGNNATFTSATANTGAGALPAVGDMVGMFGAGGGANSAVSSAWYGKIQAIVTAANATAWTATAVKTLAALGRPVAANGNLYQVTTAGTTGSTEPAWPTTAGLTVGDGTATWTCLGAATGYTLNQPALNAATNATANFFYAASRNDNITIQGGSWNCVDAFVSGHTATATFQNSFASAFRRVSNLRIRDTTWSTNIGSNGGPTTPYSNQNGGGRFTISVADFENVTIEGTTMNGTSGDGIHLTGPGNAALVQNVKSFNCGDDLVVTNLEDTNTPYMMDTEGSMSNVTVRDVVTKNGKSRAFCHYDIGGYTKYSTTPLRWTMSNLHVEKISGDTLGPMVLIQAAVTNLKIKDVVGATNTIQSGVLAQYPLVSVYSDVGPWNGITIEDVTWMGTNVAQYGIVRVADPRGPINIKNLRFGPFNAGASTDQNIGVFLNGNIVGTTYGPPVISVDGFYTSSVPNTSVAGTAGAAQTPPANTTVVYFGYCTTSTTGSVHINLRNIFNTSPTGYMVNKTSPVATPRISISDSHMASTATTGSALVNLPSGDPSCVLALNNVRSFVPLAFTQSALTVEMSNSDASTTVPLVQLTGTGATPANIRMANSAQFSTGVLVSRDGAQAIRVRGTDIPVDQTLLTPGDGDTIYNSNATPLNGTGVAVYNTAAAKWKNLFSGTTN